MEDIKLHYVSLLKTAQRLHFEAELLHDQNRTEESSLRLQEIKKIHDQLLNIKVDELENNTVDPVIIADAEKVLFNPTLN